MKLTIKEDYNMFFVSSIYEKLTDTKYLIPLTEANLNRIINGHDKMGYIVASASRQDLWLIDKNGERVVTSDADDCRKYRVIKQLEPDTQEHVDANNKRSKELVSYLRKNNYSYVPVYGGYREDGQTLANVEKSFIVLPYNIKTGEYVDFSKCVSDIMNICKKFNQDSILIKYPDADPTYYSCDDGSKISKFYGTTINDLTKQAFTSLKKWDDIDFRSKTQRDKKVKPEFTKGKPQRFSHDLEFESFQLCLNSFPGQNSELQRRSLLGEMVRFYK